MGLKLALKAGERFVVNGAVMVNGDRRSVLVVENQAAILRDRDIMQADEANTPARRVYFALMCAYLDPDNRDEYLPRFADLMADFLGVIMNADIRATCVVVSEFVLAGDFYQALGKVRALIAYEDKLLGTAAVPAPLAAACR
ncbi:MAG: flagellar biosynthesis repressor FlbT [Pacificimonas sp.]